MIERKPLHRGPLSLFAVLLFGICADSSAAEPRLQVDPERRLLMQDVFVRVVNMAPGGKVSISASLRDDSGRTWSSRGTYYADSLGMVDTAVTASVCGTYDGADADGLFWSMLPVEPADLPRDCRLRADEREWPRSPDFDDLGEVTVEFEATLEPVDLDGVETVLNATHRVMSVAPDVRREEIEEGSVRGVLFIPDSIDVQAAVMVITGSGGGVNEQSAALLASHGIPSLALGHFRYRDRPQDLGEIPLEYFREAMDLLRDRFNLDKVALLGRSRGAEAALLIASTYPELVSAVIAGVPTNVVNSGCCSKEAQGTSAWTLNDIPVRYIKDRPRLVNRIDHSEYSEYGLRRLFLPSMLASDDSDPAAIKVENIRAPILLQSGGADELWPSRVAAERIGERLERHQFEYPVVHSTNSGAGHGATSEALITSLGFMMRRPDSEARMLIGGSPTGNAQAMKAFFHERVRFVKRYAAADRR